VRLQLRGPSLRRRWGSGQLLRGQLSAGGGAKAARWRWVAQYVVVYFDGENGQGTALFKGGLGPKT
jgi:hypothetical protein